MIKSFDSPEDEIKKVLPSVKILEQIKGTSGGRQAFKCNVDGGLCFVKIHLTSSEREKETIAYRNASELLKKKHLTVPKLLFSQNRIISLEYIEGKTPNLAINADLTCCIKYIREMQEIIPPPSLIQHYLNLSLRNRLIQEKSYLLKACSIRPEFNEILPAFSSIQEKALQYVDLDMVGVCCHGDFQVKNLKSIKDDTLVPVDWGDFGRGHRAYDFGNLLYSIPANKLKDILEEIRDNLAIENISTLFTQGAYISSVLRAGAQFRHIVEVDSKDFQEKLGCAKETIDYCRQIEEFL